MQLSFPSIPAPFFGMILGLGGLSSGWRLATRVWGAPALIAEILAIAAGLIWGLWVLFFAWKWVDDRESALTEFRHPIQSFFIVLAPVATMVAGIALAPDLPRLALVMILAGGAGQLAFSAWATGSLWRGNRDMESITPALYLPTVGGSFVAANACGMYGYPDAGLLYFGAGFLSWIVLESVILQRLLTHSLPVALRATMGVHLAPPAVGCVAYLGVTQGAPDHLAQFLFGYAMLQALALVRIIPWLREQVFSPAAWAYTFGVSALPAAALRFVERGQSGPISHLALPIFVAANLIIGWIAVRTLILAVNGTLLPGRAAPPQAAPASELALGSD